MPARPLSTFASEGWYRPSSGRNEHYFRPTGHGEHVLRSLCDHWSSSEEIRPHLTPAVIRSTCAACKEPWLAMLLGPESEPWFSPEFDELASPHPTTREQIAEAIRNSDWDSLGDWDAEPERIKDDYRKNADAVLALIQNGADR